MKFIWNEPEVYPSSEGKFPRGNWTAPIIGWLNYNNVYPKIDHKHWEINYNYVWHFYDISIFECWIPGNGVNPRAAIDSMTKYLESTNLKWVKDINTWRWEGKKLRPGARFFIYSEDFQQ